ncbi:hypothetical protein VTO42DRAFT_3429 [Malbranchea cinnamomea]
MSEVGETPHENALPHLSRAASYNHISTLYPEHKNIDIKKTLSEFNLSQSTESWSQQSSYGFTTGKEILRRSSFRSNRGKSESKEPQFTLPTDDPPETANETRKEKDAVKVVERSQKSRSVAEVLVDRFRRKKWRSPQAPSPQPPQNEATHMPTENMFESDKHGCTQPQGNKFLGEPGEKKLATSYTRPQDEAPVMQTARRFSLTTIQKNKTETPSALVKKSSLKSLRKRSSLDRLAASVGISITGIPPLPSPPKNQELPSRTVDAPRQKDELWSVFRGLDADYQKFQSKSSAFKANVVRLTLIPCLSRYSDHPSNKTLRPEDLDRRINILNKWWIGLLEVLNGKNSLSLTGTDRPVYLEAILAIMTRSEWRIPPFAHPSPVAPQKQGITATSNTSLESTGSDFLVESIHHNIRNIFSQNLLSQLAYCIDRMSIRHTPASLISFCGKTCAYAFFFCPQVADVLVRIWNLTPDHLRRAANRFEVDPSPKIRASTSQEIAAYFPAPVRSLSFTSHTTLVRSLRRKILGPLAASHIDWSGPWVSRWTGRDTDLFFVFVKHFHILVTEFLPEDAKRSDLVYVPGLVPVNAQILAVLETTVNKQSVPQPLDAMHAPTSVTFDDLIDGADAPATTLPLDATNKFRPMSENRLILMLRDFLRDSTIPLLTKQLFLESFCGILKVAARKISIFNHSGCSALCDFVEELSSTVSPFCQSTGQKDLLDWEFWLEVCENMLRSNHTFTEVRAFAFIFATWNAMNALDRRKEYLCLEMLLQEKFFYEYFNHWSPMVRAYFHRLLCWRLARYDGDASELDRRIYSTLADRLHKLWNYFVSFQTTARKLSTTPLSTAPCYPAPGRRLIIIRNDYDYSGPNLLACFGDIVPPNLSATSASQGEQKDNPINEDVADASEPQIKKGWRMLKTIFSGPSNPKPGEVTPPGTSSEDIEFPSADELKHAASLSQSQTPANENKTSPESTVENKKKPHRRSSFRFTLEWTTTDRQRRIIKDRHIFPPTLPAPAQGFLQYLRAQESTQSDSTSTSNSVSIGSTDGSGSDYDDDEESRLASDLTDESIPATSTQSKPSTDTRSTAQSSATPYVITSKYAGRALAEWALVVSECDNFFHRRREEGVPCNKLVEVPALGVEIIRKPH